jgi:hypothetical protein
VEEDPAAPEAALVEQRQVQTDTVRQRRLAATDGDRREEQLNLVD